MAAEIDWIFGIQFKTIAHELHVITSYKEQIEQLRCSLHQRKNEKYQTLKPMKTSRLAALDGGSVFSLSVISYSLGMIVYFVGSQTTRNGCTAAIEN